MKFLAPSLLAVLGTVSSFQVVPTAPSSSHYQRCINPCNRDPFARVPLHPISPTIPSSVIQHAPSSSSLFSLQHLVDDVIESASSGATKDNVRTIFVGGKGGVGKTTISSSLAVTIASNYEADARVLVVSTDPAHSLGDALDVDLRSGQGEPIQMTDPLTGGRLHAAEVDPTAALNDFRSYLEAFDIDTLSNALGVSSDLLEGLGLREFSGLLNNPPPGLDELVALSNVLDSPDIKNDYDVVIVDTAPTGHTLRMLALPQFLDGFLGKLIELRMKLSGLASTIQALFGADEAAKQRAKTIDTAIEKLEQFRAKMSSLRNRLQDSDSTSFVVVTIPTKLGVAESKRLMTELGSQGVDVTDIVVNQCVGKSNEGDIDTSEALQNYYNRRKSGQQRWLTELKEATNGVSSTEEFQSNGSTGPIVVTEVPFFDVELVGVPALGYLGRTMYENNPDFEYLIGGVGDDDSKFIICGGKGGVGKTTTSSSLAVAMAASGHNVAIISTDPAHSLGDALDIDLKGGSLIECPLIGVPPTEGSLSAMEIDPTEALSQFKGIVDQLIGAKSNDDSSAGGKGGMDFGNALSDLGEVFDTLPAGTDEVVALAKVIGLIRRGEFDRVVLDTAPTGHTLRMLSTPAFLSDLIERVLVIARKVNSNAAVKMFLNSAAGGEDLDAAGEAAKAALLSFQVQMYDLEDLFADVKQTEFLIVTVPTELAVRESVRLLNDLTFEAPDMPIKVRNVVANQVLNDDEDDVKSFLNRISDGQSSSIRELKMATESMSRRPEITEVPYLDTEPRGVFGLKALSEELLRENCASAL
uniref:ArsA/GET3 Anion-transporting ATPase-like domain-containing protein n=1 Tax=Ditylum brightwellii TaxID=49249 RepID=A0A7S2A3R2_9STRA|mmetsp:Transcript_7728/g.11512  ORF Transcript_7728/g.11512 Transcript_7728/m.11512 type:complete len:810 (+) Transcript_7728:182-2611(+)